MKTLFMSLLMLALLTGTLLAFSGSTTPVRDDSNVRTADNERTETSASTTNAQENRTEERTGKSAEKTETRTGKAENAARVKNETARAAAKNETTREMMRNAAARTTANRSMMENRTMMLRQAKWNATAATRKCATESTAAGKERCLLRMANASIYSNATLREVNETELRCANVSTMRERVACRMELPEDEQKEGLYYLPEECRQKDGEERRVCLARYDSIQTCRFEDGDDARFKCVRARIGINTSAKERVDECKRQVRGNESAVRGEDDDSEDGNSSDREDEGENNSDDNNRSANNSDNDRGIGACVASVRAAVFEEAKFRIYNLEEKAERLAKYGVSNATITDFVTQLEEFKAQFVAAEGAEAKKMVLRQVEAAWKEFVKKARTEAQTNRTRNTEAS